MSNIQQIVEQDFGTEQLGVPESFLRGQGLRVNFESVGSQFRGIDIFIMTPEEFPDEKAGLEFIIKLSTKHQDFLVNGNPPKNIEAYEYQRYFINIANQVRGAAIKNFDQGIPSEGLFISLDVKGNLNAEIQRILKLSQVMHEEINPRNYELFKTPEFMDIDVTMSDGTKLVGEYFFGSGKFFESKKVESTGEFVETENQSFYKYMSDSSARIVSGYMAREWSLDNRNSLDSES